MAPIKAGTRAANLVESVTVHGRDVTNRCIEVDPSTKEAVCFLRKHDGSIATVPIRVGHSHVPVPVHIRYKGAEVNLRLVEE